jgi:hypothetical protein
MATIHSHHSHMQKSFSYIYIYIYIYITVDKIESLFPDDMVQAILDTPLFAEVQNDRISWMMEGNGRYTVKTGYKLAMMELLHIDRFHVEGEWQRIWKVNSPHKARNLLWRICRGCVPKRPVTITKCTM